ncbi:hypothetical protein Tsp_11525 [Trichinella spiralis]|uniref:hypothetical protein n=1 Tax=Trichinella spiralis TaxID=6334 RepID=UPI0001EFE31C|nr:hypothetical protein Tsp_11525 [Trichinella spiralis]
MKHKKKNNNSCEQERKIGKLNFFASQKYFQRTLQLKSEKCFDAKIQQSPLPSSASKAESDEQHQAEKLLKLLQIHFAVYAKRNGLLLRQASCPAAFYFVLYSVLPLTPVLIITESISVFIFCSLPSSPESRIHQNFSKQKISYTRYRIYDSSISYDELLQQASKYNVQCPNRMATNINRVHIQVVILVLLWFNIPDQKISVAYRNSVDCTKQK